MPSAGRNKERLSRYLSHILRHNASSFGLTLDPNGFVPLDRLVSAIRQQRKWSWVTLNDIVDVERTSDKKRFEIIGGHIRALYGHTIPSRISHEEVAPPEILYHGTSRRNAQAILRAGILPMRRQYVHLSTTAEEAEGIGLRRDEKPVVLRVLALEAYKNGVRFFRSGPLFLSERIPPKFIELEDTHK